MELVYPWNSHICAQTLLSILLEHPHLCADSPQHPLLSILRAQSRLHLEACSWNEMIRVFVCLLGARRKQTLHFTVLCV